MRHTTITIMRHYKTINLIATMRRTPEASLDSMSLPEVLLSVCSVTKLN